MGGEGEDGGVGREEAKNRLLWWVGCGRGQSPPFFPFFNNDDKKPCLHNKFHLNLLWTHHLIAKEVSLFISGSMAPTLIFMVINFDAMLL